MEQVTFGKILSKRQEVNNLMDDTRNYDITAVANINTAEVFGFDDGKVTKDGKNIATFNTYGKKNMNISYTFDDNEEDTVISINDVQREILTFIENVKTAVLTL